MPSAIDYIISTQDESGGWGYSAGRRPVVEPTAAVLLAIRDEPLAVNSFSRGVSWLLSCQHKDGGWGINEDDPESGWQTAWALLALRYSTQNVDSISQAADWLTTVGTFEISREQFKQPEIPKNDSIEAFVWPWMPEQAGFVEPTAMAVLALQGINKSWLADIRINAASSYFQKNRTPDGGWSTGNEGPLDTLVRPRAYPTALVLVALTQIDQPAIQTIDLDALRQDLSRDPSILAQSSGGLALRTMGAEYESLIANIPKHQLQNGSWDDNPFFTAWALMALRGYF